MRDTCRSQQAIVLVNLGEIRELARRCSNSLRDAMARGNIYAAALYSPALVGQLASDDAAGAAHELSRIRESIPKEGFRQPDVWIMISSAYVALYRADPVAGHTNFLSRWPELERSQLLSVCVFRQHMFHLRAGLDIMTANEARDPNVRRRRLTDAQSMAKKLRGLPVPGSAALADLVLAGVAALEARNAYAIERLTSAAPSFDAAHMRAFAAATRYQLGMLRGDAEGARLMADAEAWFREEGVVAVPRFVGMLAPGFARPQMNA